MYQRAFLLSIHLKPVDGFSRQRNCLPWFQYLASSALPSMFTTWQAMHTCMIWYLASRACTYRFCYLASRVQNAICEIARVVRIAVQYFASSVQNRSCAISAPARWEHIPNPEIAQLRAARFQKTLGMSLCHFSKALRLGNNEKTTFPPYFSNLKSLAVIFEIKTESKIPLMTTTGSAHVGLTAIKASAYPAGISSTAHSYV